MIFGVGEEETEWRRAGAGQRQRQALPLYPMLPSWLGNPMSNAGVDLRRGIGNVAVLLGAREQTQCKSP